MTEVDRALLLERHPWAESSAVVSVLSRRHGPVRLVARGLQRPRSRFYALLDFFDELELEWTPPKRGELGQLRAGRLLHRRRGIPADLERYRAGHSMLELARLSTRPGQVERALFDLLNGALEELADPEVPPAEARLRFQLGFLRLHGLSPALERCASCGGEAPASGQTPSTEQAPRASFSAGAGGRLCARCAAERRAAGGRVGTLPLDVLETAARMSRGQGHARDPELLLRVRDFVERFLDYHLETRPRSHRLFLAAANRNAPSRTR